MSSIALSIGVYNDAMALRGLLETAQRFYDNIFVANCGPGGNVSTDGTIELCEQFGIKPALWNMDDGFGAIRTRLLHDCGCEWAIISDADERIYPELPVLRCDGTDRYPAQPFPNLKVTKQADIISQGAHIKNQINNPKLMAMRFTRRHWFDFSMTRPAENWETIYDHQLRCVRNTKHIHYERKMHELLVDDRTGKTPFFLEQDPIGGPFIDHFHLFFRKAQPGHKEANEQNYARLERGEAMIP